MKEESFKISLRLLENKNFDGSTITENPKVFWRLILTDEKSEPPLWSAIESKLTIEEEKSSSLSDLFRKAAFLINKQLGRKK